MSGNQTGTTGADANNGQSTQDQSPQPGAPAPAQSGASQPSPQQGAPEKYAEFKLPEGVTLDASDLEALTKVAKERGYSQEQAQRFVEDRIGERLEVVNRLKRGHEDQLKQWVAEARADKEYGGEKLNENLALAEKALEEHGTPALKDVLIKSGLANHPEVVRLFFRLGKLMSEDTLAKGKGEQPAAAEARVFTYPNSKHAA